MLNLKAAQKFLLLAFGLFILPLRVSVLAGPVEVPYPKGNITPKTLIAHYQNYQNYQNHQNHQNPEITLYPLKNLQEGFIVGIQVNAGKVSRSFPAWRSISNPTFWPAVEVKDLTGDKNPELLVHLMIDEGTGVAIFDAHVLTLPDLRELPISAPISALKKMVTLQKGQIVLNGKTIKLTLPEGISRNTQVEFGDHLEWSVVAGKLVATADIRMSWASVADLKLSYKLSGGKFVPDAIRYAP